MDLKKILSLKTTVNNAKADTKKAVLDLISSSIVKSGLASTDIDAGKIIDCLVAREKLGSTATGHGVAIPHCRLPELNAPIAAIIKLQKAIDYDAADGEPVDLFFALLVPESATNEHLKILAAIAEKFGHPTLRTKLRLTKTKQELFDLLTKNQ